jgi:hypothetical protein
VTYNATDDEFASFMCGNLDILRAHGMAVRAVPTPFTAGSPTVERQAERAQPPSAEPASTYPNPATGRERTQGFPVAGLSSEDDK